MGSKLQIGSGHCVSDASFGEGDNNRMRDALQRLYVKLQVFREDNGQDLIEYALLAAIITMACVAMMGFVATQINTGFNHIGTKLSYYTS
jgi:Flp pilus assembly pilin Flp